MYIPYNIWFDDKTYVNVMNEHFKCYVNRIIIIPNSNITVKYYYPSGT